MGQRGSNMWRGHLAQRVRYTWRTLLRVRATPHQIALGAAIGVFSACTPFFGVQMALAAAIAYGIGGSIPAALIATFVGNPLSWPAIWGVSYVAGAWMLGVNTAYAADQLVAGVRDFHSQVTVAPVDAMPMLVVNAWPLFQPFVIGGCAIGLFAALISYYPMWRAVTMFQQRRA